VDQITQAAQSMDAVTQQNSAGAEQYAASSRQLAEHSAALRGNVTELVRLLEGRAPEAPASGQEKRPPGRTAVEARPARSPRRTEAARR
jgi:small-conductance mechanosensitive channel